MEKKKKLWCSCRESTVMGWTGQVGELLRLSQATHCCSGRERRVNLRIFTVGRHLWRSSSPIPRHGTHLDQVTQEGVQLGFKCPQTRGLHKPLGASFSTLNVKKLFFMSTWNLIFNLWLLLLILSLGTTAKSGTILLTHANGSRAGTGAHPVSAKSPGLWT